MAVLLILSAMAHQRQVRPLPKRCPHVGIDLPFKTLLTPDFIFEIVVLQVMYYQGRAAATSFFLAVNRNR